MSLLQVYPQLSDVESSTLTRNKIILYYIIEVQISLYKLILSPNQLFRSPLHLENVPHNSL